MLLKKKKIIALESQREQKRKPKRLKVFSDHLYTVFLTA